MTMQDLLSAVTAEKTVEDSLLSLISGLTTQLKAALATSDLGTVDQIVSQIQANTAAMQAAVVANTPSSPTPVASTSVVATTTTSSAPVTSSTPSASTTSTK